VRNKINLLPERPKVKQSVGPIVLALIILGAVLLSCLAGLYSFRRQAIIKTQERIEEVKAAMALIKPDVDALAKVEARANEIRTLYDEVIALEDPHISPALFLAQLKTSVPADMWLTSANVSTNEVVTIKGFTFSYQSVARGVFSLEAASMLKDLKVSSITRTEEDGSTSYEDFTVLGALERRR